MIAARKGTIFRLFRDITTCHAMRFLLGLGTAGGPLHLIQVIGNSELGLTPKWGTSPGKIGPILLP